MSHHDEDRRSAGGSLPTAWETLDKRRPTRAAILGALFHNRAVVREQYPHLLLPSRPRPTPVVVLLDLWHDWELASAACGRCGGVGLATFMGGMLSIGSMSGICIDCKHIVHRTFGGGIGTILIATAELRKRHGYHFFAGFPGTWSLEGSAMGVVAVLQELGVPGLRLTRAGRL